MKYNQYSIGKPTKWQKVLAISSCCLIRIGMLFISALIGAIAFQQFDMYTNMRVDIISIFSSLIAMATYKTAKWLFRRF